MRERERGRERAPVRGSVLLLLLSPSHVWPPLHVSRRMSSLLLTLRGLPRTLLVMAIPEWLGHTRGLR